MEPNEEVHILVKMIGFSIELFRKILTGGNCLILIQSYRQDFSMQSSSQASSLQGKTLKKMTKKLLSLEKYLRVLVFHDGLFWLRMLQIAESFIHLTFSTTVYYFHQSFE